MHKDKRIRVRGEKRDEVDIYKLSRAVIALAAAQAEKEAAALHKAEDKAAATQATKPKKKAS